LDISSTSSFVLILLFLFSINVSIAAAYIFLFLIIPAFFYRIIVRKPSLPQLPRFFLSALIFTLASLVSTAFSSDPITSLKDNRDLLNFLLIPILMLTLITFNRIKWALSTLFASTVFVSIVGLFITLQRVLNHQDPISLDHRLKGLTSHWMTYSGLLMMGFVFFLVYQHYEKNPTTRKSIIMGLVIISIPILLTQTRSVWVGIIISVTLFLLSFNWKRVLILIPLVLIVYGLSPQTIQNRIQSIFDTHSPSNRDRIHMIYTSWEIFKEFPWTGVGANNVAAAYHQYRHPDAIQNNLHLHNNFMHILAERGLIGLFPLLLLFFFIAWDLVRLSRIISSNGTDVIAKAALFTFVSFMVAGLFEYNFGDTEIFFALFFYVSLPFLPPYLQKSADQPLTT